MARKNYLSADTRHGGEISTMYFMLVSARMNSLNPEKYLSYVLKELSICGLRDKVIARWLPYSKQLPDELKTNKEPFRMNHVRLPVSWTNRLPHSQQRSICLPALVVPPLMNCGFLIPHLEQNSMSCDSDKRLKIWNSLTMDSILSTWKGIRFS